jgi:hypothetical protein
MIPSSYLETVRNDLLGRVTGGSIKINDSVTSPIEAATISSHPIVGIENAVALEIKAPHVTGVPVITNVKLLTVGGALVAEKNCNVQTNGAQFLSFTFVVQVKGGE